MQRILLKSKIHRATVTDAQLHYEGSVTIDRELMELADLMEFEQVQIYDVNNGNRLTTYVISGDPGSGTICINGAAAHQVHPGDLIIICAYAHVDDADAKQVRPRVVHVDEHNRPQ
ncbi:MAG TPA: aspartate 1-decarboxylase [Planctomycetaceae bacterium]|nr:aspartate 1-decarboxylase [Planctomycetaceae bacterium]